MFLARKIFTILVLAAALVVDASATGFFIPNVTMGSGAVNNGQAITFNLSRVGNTNNFVVSRAVDGTSSAPFPTPPGAVIRNLPPRIMPNGSSAVVQANCGAYRCGVVFDALGNSTLISQPGRNIDVTAILDDGTWIGNIGGVGASFGTIGQSNSSLITSNGLFSAYAAALQTGLLTTVGAVTNGSSSYAVETIGGVLSLLPDAGPNSAAFGVSPNGQIRVGNNGLRVSQWANGVMSNFQMADSTSFQEGFAYSATNSGAVSGSDLNDLGFLYLPLYDLSYNACAGIVKAGGVLQGGQTVDNCTLGRIYTVGERFNNVWNYTVFASGSDHKYTNLDPYAFNRPGWQPELVGGSADVPEPSTYLMMFAGLLALVIIRDCSRRGITFRQVVKDPSLVYRCSLLPRYAGMVAFSLKTISRFMPVGASA